MNAKVKLERFAQVASKKTAIWSIGIYKGQTLSQLQSARVDLNPVLSASDVSDIKAQFVADPFMVKVSDTWYMFFEVMNKGTGKGEIGLATSKNGLTWKYEQIVLTEPFHLSYPYVFCLDGEFYMVPESYEANSIRLYRANPFPIRWSLVRSILEGPWVDSSIFFFDGRWWLFANPESPPDQVLELFYAKDITATWYRHPMSPLVKGNNRIARSAGRVVVAGNNPIRFTQDCFPCYGTSVRAFEVSVLNTFGYLERDLVLSPILSSGKELWHRTGMHHIDPHLVDGSWLACVDGWRFETQTYSTVEI